MKTALAALTGLAVGAGAGYLYGRRAGWDAHKSVAPNGFGVSGVTEVTSADDIPDPLRSLLDSQEFPFDLDDVAGVYDPDQFGDDDEPAGVGFSP